jgi:hypothetical protein
MWTLVRAVVAALALTTLVGQAEAHARTLESMGHGSLAVAQCPDMDRASPHEPSGSDPLCPDADPACMIRTVCGAPLVPPLVGICAPVVLLVSEHGQVEPERAPEDVWPDRLLRPPRARG